MPMNEERKMKTEEFEDFAEYLWRDFYEVKRKLTISVIRETFEL